MTGGSPAQPGYGPGEGAAATTTSARRGDGTFTGNQFLTPLFGGSGGGGGLSISGGFGGGGGGGGGGLLIEGRQLSPLAPLSPAETCARASECKLIWCAIVQGRMRPLGVVVFAPSRD